jgi:hypothetical protein
MGKCTTYQFESFIYHYLRDYETVTLTLLLEYVFTLLLFAGIKRLITT